MPQTPSSSLPTARLPRYKTRNLVISTNKICLSTERIFSDFVATSPDHWLCAPLSGPRNVTLGVLEELTPCAGGRCSGPGTESAHRRACRPVLMMMMSSKA